MAVEQISHSALDRVAASAAVYKAPAVVLFPLQAFAAQEVFKVSQQLPPEVIVGAAIAVWLGSIAVGTYLEVNALKSQKWSAVPFASGYSEKLQNHPWAASLLSSASTLIYAQFSNPADVKANFDAIGNPNHAGVLAANLISRSIVYGLYSGAWNWAIAHGYADPIVEAVAKVRHKVERTVDQVAEYHLHSPYPRVNDMVTQALDLVLGNSSGVKDMDVTYPDLPKERARTPQAYNVAVFQFRQ